MDQRGIPKYFVYGEPVRALDVGFMHVELVSARKSLHRGEVKAHKHPQMGQITYWVKGSGIYRIEDKSWRFSAPAVSFVPSAVVHGFSVTEKSDAIVVSMADDALRATIGRRTAELKSIFVPKRGNSAAWKDLAAVMALLKREYQDQKPLMPEAMSHLAGLALALIGRLGAAAPGSEITHRHSLALRLQELVDLHFRDNWSIERYVLALGSTYHLLDKAAQAAFGKPVKQVILERRMLEAKRLLRFTIRPAEDIAYELGFKDPAYFSREFKKHLGMAPGTWRSGDS
jgi:AraC family transcriptional regulator, transcriptional activator of pobA